MRARAVPEERLNVSDLSSDMNLGPALPIGSSKLKGMFCNCPKNNKSNLNAGNGKLCAEHVRATDVPESLSKFDALSSVVNFGPALPIGSRNLTLYMLNII